MARSLKGILTVTILKKFWQPAIIFESLRIMEDLMHLRETLLPGKEKYGKVLVVPKRKSPSN